MISLIPLPYRILAVVVLWFASLTAVGLWQRHDGASSVQAKWQARETAQQAAAAKRIQQLSDAARKTEQASVAKMNEQAEDYERKLSDANKQRRTDVAAVRAGTLRLRDPNASAVRTCPDTRAKAGPASGVGDGTEGGGFSEAAAGLLSAETGAWLIDFAADADRNTIQLGACQKVIASMARLCSAE